MLAANAAVARVERVPVMWAQAVPVVPNDPLWAEQWDPRQVRVDQAWATTTGSSDIVVAVVDTGVNEVPDLAGRVLPGWNFVDDNDNRYDGAGHGTAVASVAAGTANNGIAGAGVCQECLILPVKVLDHNGNGSALDIAAGIKWAVKHGADIINLSLGGPDTLPELDSAVAAAEGARVLVVAAAGTTAAFSTPSPGLRHTRRRMAVCCRSARIPRTAGAFRSPTTAGTSTWPRRDATTRTTARWKACSAAPPSPSPMVAGVAALAMSQTPGLSPQDWRELIRDTSVGIGDWLLAGRVDALALLARDDTQPPVASITDPAGGTPSAASSPSQPRPVTTTASAGPSCSSSAL